MNRAVYALVFLCAFAPGTMPAQPLFGPDSTARRSRSFDVLHYALVVSFDEAAETVTGSATIRLTPLAVRLDSVVLDAVDMDVRSVALGGRRKALFHNRTPELTVNLDRAYAPGETLSVTVEYSCRPAKGLYFIRDDSSGNRHAQIWTQGEDMDNRYWFPCYDYPNDKATSEVTATVREDFTLLSNGRLVSETRDRPGKTRTFHWRQAKPHSAYLIMIAAGRYAVVQERYGRLPLSYYVYPADTAKVRQTFGGTADMMRFFEDYTGVPYPWEKFAQVIIDDFMWGGMENTSVVTLNTATVVDARGALDFPSEGVVAHELAHQWWGDMVTCRDWTHLWLNEGFATYAECLYSEAVRGEDEFQYAMIQSSYQIRNSDRIAGRKPIVSHESFPTNLYSRGAWVLHMLRDILGDDLFRRGMRAYLARYAYACAETNEFRLALEDATGQNLDWFFDQWVTGAGLPKLTVTKEWDEESKELTVHLTQKQPADSLTGVFRFPVRMEFTTRGGKTARRYWVNAREEVFRVPLDGPPLMVIADKGYWLLKEIDFPKSAEEYLYQLVHAEDVADRITAARSLGENEGDAGVIDGLAAAAAGDRFWGVRQAALAALGEMKGDTMWTIMARALGDPSPRVRATAAEKITTCGNPSTPGLLDSLARNDSSYVVAATCMRELVAIDSVRGFLLACDMIGRPSYRNQLQTAACFALRRMHDPRGVDVVLPYTSPRHALDTRRLATGVLGVNGKDVPAARDRLRELLEDRESGVRASAVSAVGGWHDDEFNGVLRAMEEKETDPAVLTALRSALASE